MQHGQNVLIVSNDRAVQFLHKPVQMAGGWRWQKCISHDMVLKYWLNIIAEGAERNESSG